MSGIEVVGLLLGAFPLIISAFEHYRDIAKVAGLLANWETENLNSLNEVKDEEIIFRQNIVLLLWPLVNREIVEKDELDALIANPGSDAWQSADVEQALSDRLGDISERYICLMQELQVSMVKLLQSLGFDRPKFQSKLARKHASTGSISELVASANRQFLKRVDQLKFGFGKAARDDALAEIRRKNEKLEKLLRGCDKVAKLQETERVTMPRKASRALLQYWQHAGRIYALFQGSWVCSCKRTHCAHLWLHHPSANANELKLLILWAPTASQSNERPLWRPQDLQISWIQSQSLRNALQVATAASTVQIPAGKSAVQNSNGLSRPKKRVKFEMLSNNTASVPSAASSVTSNARTATSVSQAAMPGPCDGLIRDLCKAMASCGMAPQQLGALSDAAGLQYIVCSQPETRITPVEVSLYEILRQRKDKPLKRRSDRFRIALAVASAHLQLRSTPWARRQWETKDILFPVDPQDHDLVKFEPYISADFNDTLAVRDQQPRQTDRSFASLGIMLLELCFGCVLEEHEIWARPGLEQNKSDPVFRTMVAVKWSEEVEGEAGPNFAAATDWCLKESPMTLDGDQWRKDLADQVVMPLQHCWDCIKPKAATWRS